MRVPPPASIKLSNQLQIHNTLLREFYFCLLDTPVNATLATDLGQAHGQMYSNVEASLQKQHQHHHNQQSLETAKVQNLLIFLLFKPYYNFFIPNKT